MRSCEYWQVFNLSNTVFKSNKLCLLHINIRFLQKNFDDCYQLISSFAKLPDSICISETRLKAKSFIKLIYRDTILLMLKLLLMLVVWAFTLLTLLTFNVNDKLYIECEDCKNFWIIGTTGQETFVVSSVYWTST